ncbi:response regulator [Oleiagrimonas sp. C23AA]|uniref:response regulator n=1 Tax=Oleiagrimonas sp. C23AA TaxID=2719047 RepID=UPI0014212500|nr:response regulator [Oleiagrimonas sp. C23AA]NII09943.1 response regulator [Oleiagrimonas sp. C23AA]
MQDGKSAAAAATRVRILQVEDSELDAELIIDELCDDGLICEVRLVADEQAYLAALDEFDPHIVLSDLSMPGFDGHRALELLRERDRLLPFIFVSGTIGEDAAIRALRNGATDYILKHNMTRMATAVHRALREANEQRAREHAENELMRAQRFESLALLAGGLSHDLRNLLQPLLLAADTLDDYSDDPRLRRLGDLVRDCGRRGLEMVTSMLTFARGARRAERVRVGGLFDALGLLLQGSVPKKISLNIDADDPEQEFEGNHTELQQCLLNLCLNAMQAMPEGGHLNLHARQVELDDGFFNEGEAASGPGTYLRLSVSDTGTGMTPEVLERLFQPFFTTKDDGTGLGLLSCKRIVGSHEGVLRVESEVGEGTTFHLYLPLRDAAELDDSDAMPYGDGEQVLVVVEEAAQLSLLSDTLDSYGYQVRTSQSGTAALQAIGQSGLPDMVVMDADMNLLTGVRTLVALMEKNYNGAVLLLTRPEAPPNLEELPPLPHLQVLEKPVNVGSLLRATKRSLELARADREDEQTDGTQADGEQD